MYAALMLAVTVLAARYVFGIAPGMGPVFVVASLGAAFAVARPDGRFDRAVVVFVALSLAIWAVSIGGQLYQRYVPPSDELRILIDPLRLGVALASEGLLAIAGLSLLRR